MGAEKRGHLVLVVVLVLVALACGRPATPPSPAIVAVADAGPRETGGDPLEDLPRSDPNAPDFALIRRADVAHHAGWHVDRGREAEGPSAPNICVGQPPWIGATPEPTLLYSGDAYLISPLAGGRLAFMNVGVLSVRACSGGRSDWSREIEAEMASPSIVVIRVHEQKYIFDETREDDRCAAGLETWKVTAVELTSGNAVEGESDVEEIKVAVDGRRAKFTSATCKEVVALDK